MFEIIVPASTANLGIGFDSLGLALSLTNTFTFEKSDKTTFHGFEKEYSNEKNLVFLSYSSVFQKLNLEIPPISITLTKQEIPISRGLGSSSSCIIAGAMAANKILHHPLTDDELLSVMMKLEGHPDNLCASLFGGLVCSFIENKKVFHLKNCVSSRLHFHLLVPPFEVSTHDARNSLPTTYPKEEVVHVLSRAYFLIDAFEQGDLEMLQRILKDLIHEPYRYPLIHDGLSIKEKVESLGACVLISGSGPTLFVITDDCSFSEKLKGIKLLTPWKTMEVLVSTEGTLIEVKEESS